MDGVIYLHNQAGLALAQANQRIEELTQAVESLQKLLADKQKTKDAQ